MMLYPEILASLATALNQQWSENEAVDWDQAEYLVAAIKEDPGCQSVKELKDIIDYADATDEWDSGYVANWPDMVLEACKAHTDPYGEPVHIYTRADALRDGQLIDMGNRGSQYGLRYPAAVTSAAFECINKHLDDAEATFAAILGGFLQAYRRLTDKDTDTVMLKVGIDKLPEPIELKAMIHPGDTPEPVFTFMLGYED